MKKIRFIALAGLLSGTLTAQVTLDYYLPDDIPYNKNIPLPESVVGHQVGEWLITHDKLVYYMQTIAEISDRASLQVYGYSYENRPLLHVIFSSPGNIEKLDRLKTQHAQLSDPSLSGQMNISDMPLVVTLGYSVHGNESSGANSALLTAYYLAAAEGPEIEQLLENTIILVDPCLNPDGLTRFATWGNMHKSQMVSSDPNNRAFDEVWPGGRTNHYWYDLNRDYLLLANPETKGRVQKIHEWKPNIMTDHHEMGSNSTFFFQPGVPSRNNPMVPEKNFDLTKIIGSYHAKALDNIGSYYFSEEVFDDFYLGKGSAYPDINGGIGILFEQAGVRGFKRQTQTGIMTFPFAIKNQFTVTLSTLQAAGDMRLQLLEYMREFYQSAFRASESDPVKAYIFGAPHDTGRTREFVNILNAHKIDLYKVKSSFTSGGYSFPSNYSYIVPLKQKQYRLIKALFEPINEFADSTFYDVSTWTLPFSFNMPHSAVTNNKTVTDLMGNKIMASPLLEGTVQGSSHPVAWAFRWDDYFAPRVLSRLLSEGIQAKVATSSFGYKREHETFHYGTILIPANQQILEPDEISSKLEELARESGIDFHALETGWTDSGMDLGSGSFRDIPKPQILMLIGEGTNSRDAGEIWHLFDVQYQTTMAMVESERFNDIELSDYTTIIVPGGSPSGLSDAGIENLKRWLQGGGTLIAYKNAAHWAVSNDLLKISFKPGVSDEHVTKYAYGERYRGRSKHVISGAIFEVQLDLTHPLAYGFQENKIPVFKSGNTVAELPLDPYQAPILYSQAPLLSGFASQENIDRIKGSPFLVTQGYGRGRIITILDNTNFRGVWFGTNKIFANAVFFGNLVGGSSRY